MSTKKIVIIVAAIIVVAAGVTAMVLGLKGNDGKEKAIGANTPTTIVESTPTPQISARPSASATDANKSDFKDIKVKAVYLTGTSAGSKKTLTHIIDLVNTTELNAVVIDIKDNGKVNYESNVPEVKKNGAFEKLYKPKDVIKKLHDNHIYVIGRVVCFKDNVTATKRADLAIKTKDGNVWRENKKVGWINPYVKEARQYNIDIAKEAVEMGFDEIQFDYVRFPAAPKKLVDYGVNPPPKSQAINTFLEDAYKELHDMGVKVSADVFGIICESPGDVEGIGQVIEEVGKYIDYICPMVYPSHYANNSQGTMGNGVGQKINGVSFTAPDLKPYEVVYNTLLKAKERISKVSDYNAKVRPYLQDFTATYLPKGYYKEYGVQEVKEQIKAVYDAGYEEWILWDGRNTYTEDAILKDTILKDTAQ